MTVLLRSRGDAVPVAPRRVLSLLKPTGHLTLGNYLGALRPMSRATGDCFFGVCNLHALTITHDPDQVRRLTAETARLMLAAGLDPDRHTLFIQSDVPAHTGLHYLLECGTTVGELNRMIQYKEKGRGRPETRASLFSYPVLMAADILLYAAAEVPVGDDQRQHVELARDIALRFNANYGEVFVVPVAVKPPVAARVMDLQDPSSKMGKTNVASKLSQPHVTGAGVIFLLDDPDTVVRKVRRAVTDSAGVVEYDRTTRPGVSNLLEIAAACTDRTIEQVTDEHRTYGSLKDAVAEAVLAVLQPIQTRYAATSAEEVDAVFAGGAERARAVAAPMLAAARKAIGV
ncbi:MAG: trpS [Propionibacteriaceae bacterium]|jgi:tryptophanyl-tRNA synthetase|nr:trpS [Propionibacteriaceae bacterium]